MPLDVADQQWLTDQGFEFEVVDESGWTNLIFKDYVLPPGFDRERSDLLVRLPPGFPDAPPDMFWVDPPIRLSRNQAFAQASEAIESHVGRSWQRFSRHLQAGAWRPGIDSLESWIKAIRLLLAKDGAA